MLRSGASSFGLLNHIDAKDLSRILAGYKDGPFMNLRF